MIIPDLKKFKPTTPLETYMGFSGTIEASLVDLDRATDLLNHDEFVEGGRVPDVLRRKKKPLPDKLQWPIVATLCSTRLRPMTVLWLALKPNALPDIVLRAWVRETAEYLIERAFTQSVKAWNVAGVLDQLSKSIQLVTLERLERGRDVAKQLYAGAQNEHQRMVALALFNLLQEDPREAMVAGAGFAIDGRKALRVRDEGAVVIALATKLRRLCEKALEKHPQKDLLKQQI